MPDLTNDDGGASRTHDEDLLDQALKETFPASDPIAVYLPVARASIARDAAVSLEQSE